jgi:hypothetical protein
MSFTSLVINTLKVEYLFTTFESRRNPMKNSITLLALLIAFGCTQKRESKRSAHTDLNAIAIEYVRLGLDIGQYDPPFVDAYYGPDSLKPTGTPKEVFPKDSLLRAVNNLVAKLDAFDTVRNDTVKNRAGWIKAQLRAFSRRIRIVSGEFGTFEEETKDLYGVTVPVNDEAHFKAIVSSLDRFLPGKGNVIERFQKLANRFIIPKEKLDTVFKAAIAEARKRTLAHVELPASEDFKLEYVTNKSWSGYNWYKGQYQSLIQINTDLNIFVDRAIDVGSHESYPGHHVYNMLMEKNLYRDKGQVEISFYPLYSPQSFIAEGTANEGVEVVFPDEDKIEFSKSVLLPLAGLDTTGITQYFNAMAIREALNYARNEVARGLINETMKEPEAIRWLKEYALMNDETAVKSIAFIKAHRSYVVNYNYGKDVAHHYIEKNSAGDEAKRWNAFIHILKNQVSPESLIK